MKSLKLQLLLCAALSLPVSLQAGLAPSAPATGHSFRAVGDHFELDGKPFRVLAGEMHYARVPREYWRDRLRKAKAMGLNTITTYVFWNVHEPEPGVYDFSGNNDVAEFIREAQQEGLYVNLRPGPYSCAEWDFGGFPSWLLKDHSMVVRSTDPKFLAAASRWLHRLGQELAPLQIGRGGPIITVQIENEYGSFGKDRAYLNAVRKIIVDSGFADAQLYTADGAEELPDGSFPDLPAAINFGTGDARNSFEQLLKMRPNAPRMAGEYWDGWFDHWGDKHQARNAQQQIDEFRWIVDHGYSVSVYMFHGGTSFGFMSGANSDHDGYQPDVTSYDYQATLDESGRPTAKYWAFRDIITKATGITPPAVPPSPAPIAIAPFQLAESRSLWQSLPAPIESAEPLTMEDIGQSYGYILYRTKLNNAGDGDLILDELHSYARVYLDGNYVGSLDRRLAKNSLPLHVDHAGRQLDILVENSGRVNFSIVLRGERTGITHRVSWRGQTLEGWQIYPLPMLSPEKGNFAGQSCTGPCFYQGQFNLVQTGDTFLDVRSFGKGAVWINGHALGRFWDIGPQQTLYVPGPWLKQGSNEIVVFDLESKGSPSLHTLDHPILDGPSRGIAVSAAVFRARPPSALNCIVGVHGRTALRPPHPEVFMHRRDLLKLTAYSAGAFALRNAAKAEAPAHPVIDTHIHLFDTARPGGVPWPEKSDTALYKPALPPRYQALSAPFGVVGAIAIEASPLPSDNDWLLDVAEKNSIIVGIVGDLIPGDGSYRAALDRLHQNPLFLGIRYGNLWGRDLGADLDKPGFIEGLKALAQAGLVLDTANPDFRLIRAILGVSDGMPDLRLVIDHLPNAVLPDSPPQIKEYWAALHRLAQNPNVYIKLSEIPVVKNGKLVTDAAFYHDRLDEMWSIFGEDHILFGSDWPNSDHVVPFDATFSIVRDYNASKPAAAASKYFWKNSKSAYRWHPRTPQQQRL